MYAEINLVTRKDNLWCGRKAQTVSLCYSICSIFVHACLHETYQNVMNADGSCQFLRISYGTLTHDAVLKVYKSTYNELPDKQSAVL